MSEYYGLLGSFYCLLTVFTANNKVVSSINGFVLSLTNCFVIYMNMQIRLCSMWVLIILNILSHFTQKWFFFFFVSRNLTTIARHTSLHRICQYWGISFSTPFRYFLSLSLLFLVPYWLSCSFILSVSSIGTLLTWLTKKKFNPFTADEPYLVHKYLIQCCWFIYGQ